MEQAVFYYWVSAGLYVGAIYLCVRMIWPSRMPLGWKLACTGLLAFLAGLPALVTHLQWYYSTFFYHDGFYWLMYSALGYMTMLTLAQALRDTAVLARATHRRCTGKACTLPPPRRAFFYDMANLGVVGSSLLLTGCGVAQAKGRPEVVAVDVPIANLPKEFDGFTIAQLTDIHIGPTIKRPQCMDVVRQCNDLGADMIAVTGDVVDGHVHALESDLEPLADLTAKYGVFFVTGNHEYYSGAAHWIHLMQTMGHRTLQNEHEMLVRGDARLCIAGVHDVQGGWYLENHWTKPAKALEHTGRRDATIMLAHHPSSIQEVCQYNVDLQLSGHTHGGQYFPGNLLARFTQGYVAGLYRHQGSWLYVSRGTGYWGPPIRLGVPPEMTLITLRRATV